LKNIYIAPVFIGVLPASPLVLLFPVGFFKYINPSSSIFVQLFWHNFMKEEKSLSNLRLRIRCDGYDWLIVRFSARLFGT
jgi:hypothetical protein